MVCVCRPLPPSSASSSSLLRPLQLLSLGGSMFISRHDMRMAFIYCDPRAQFLIGYDPCELLGHTVYQFHNPLDAHKCSECHNSLIKTGNGVSGYYRYLGKTGTWVWMQTRATIVSDTRGQPQYVVCNNYIISQKEGERSLQMELQQQQLSQTHHSQQRLLAADLLAKGALDLPSLTQASSPVSVTDSEHEQHDDTGYSSAVSSMGSATTSPCPVVGLGGGLDLDPCLLASHRRLALRQDFPKEKDSDDLEASLVQGLESTAELGFHSTLSSAIYGEFGVQDLPSSLDNLTGVDGGESMADSFDLSSLPSASNKHPDPFLCEAGSGRGRGEGSLTNVMEDMEVLDNLLQDIGRECDSSHDTVFPSSPLSQSSSHSPGEVASVGEAQTGVSGKGVGSLLMDTLISGQGDRTSSDSAGKDPCVLTAVVDGARPPSLLRTLLDKEGEAVKACPPAVEAWTKPFPAGSLSSDKAGTSQVMSHKGQTLSASGACTVSMVSKDREQSCGGGKEKQQSCGGAGVGQQLVMYGGKQVLVPREVDLTAEHSEEEGEDLSSYSDSLNLQPVLPDDLMDFAMQYCDPANSRDGVETDILAEVEAHVWNSMDHLMGDDSTCLPSAQQQQSHLVKNTPPQVIAPSGKTISQDVREKVYSKHGAHKEDGETATPVLPQLPNPTSEMSCVIQSDTISSTCPDQKPAVTVIRSSGTGKGKAEPSTKDKMAAILRMCSFSPRVQTNALSDHKYSSTPALSPNTDTRPPSGKRMRTHWDKTEAGEKQSLESEVTCTHSMDTPALAEGGMPDPQVKGQTAARSGLSPKCGAGSLPRPLSQGSKPSSQPTSPLPAPIPVNGGGKPLTAMSELEKHLRGLVAPPDEREKDSGDILTPLEESSTSGSRPFLELLLTGKISHERYRQIDYHLLYQERERRLEENGQTS